MRTGEKGMTGGIMGDRGGLGIKGRVWDEKKDKGRKLKQEKG